MVAGMGQKSDDTRAIPISGALRYLTALAIVGLLHPRPRSHVRFLLAGVA